MDRVAAADYYDIVQVSDPVLAPDGEAAAFVRTVPRDADSYESTVYAVPTGADDGERSDGDGGARPFTTPGNVDSTPRFSPDGDRLAFVSDRGDGDSRQVWTLPTDGGEARRATAVPGTPADLAWSPDGARLAFVQRTTALERDAGDDCGLDDPAEYERETPDPRVIDRLVYREGTDYLDGTRPHVYVLDVADGSVTRVTDGDFDHAAPAWGDEKTLYFGAKRTGDPDDNVVWDVRAHDVDAGETETVTRTTGWGFALDATPDGRVAYLRTPEDRTSMRQADVEVYDRSADETRTLTAALDRTVDVGVGVEWGPAGEYVYFLTPDEGRVLLRRAADAADSTPETVTDAGHATGFSAGSHGVVLVRSDWNHRGDVFFRSDGETRRLTRVNADYIDSHRVCEPEEVRFESDGREVQGWVLTPPEFDPDETYPAVVEIHGGPHAMWSTSDTMWHEFQTLAARGYVVLWSNPRGSTGYGEAFETALERDWGRVTARDVLAGVNHLTRYDYVDEKNLFVTGGSFGGYMTGWLVGHTDRFRAAVAQRGVYELAAFYGTSDAFKLVEWEFGTTPWEDPELLWEQSPAAYASEVETPTLVMHAARDFRVPADNGETFYRYLKKNGAETRLVRYPRDGHELSRSGEPGHVVDRLERTARWFDGYSDHHDVPRALDRGDEGLTRRSDDS